MSYSDIKYLVKIITDKLDRYDIKYKIHHSSKSSSTYIKIGKKLTIRVADHYSMTDHYCQFNIGYHISKFSKRKNSYYYKYDRINNMTKKIIKIYKDNKGKV